MVKNRNQASAKVLDAASQHERLRECAIHGSEWDRVHGGYFSNPAVAEPLARQIRATADRVKPHAIVDLGGGTGYLLHELASRGLATYARLVNLDASAEQLGQGRDPRVTRVQGSLAEVTRGQFAKEADRALFTMRSVLHYFGCAGLAPMLQKLRSIMQPGEIFIHQTACFENARAAKCINRLYELMDTDKWYPMRAGLCMSLMELGWRVEATAAAAPLPMGSLDLARRYSLSTARLAKIHEELSQEYGDFTGVFQTAPRGFTAYLPYTIFTCIAV